MYFGIAVIIVIPIIMVILSVTLDYAVNRWVNIIAAGFFFVFNLMGLKGYKPYDKFLIIVSFGFNVLTIIYAWNWV